jgi:C1A family cysteine protease
MIQIQRLGWRGPDRPDKRDKIYSAKPVVVPRNVNLQSGMPGIYDQGQAGSCTANALAALVQYDQMRQKRTDWVPSRLFVYYLERYLEHTTRVDAGASLRDGMKVLRKYGVCPETTWPYDLNNLFIKPSQQALNEALQEKVVDYYRVQHTIDQMRLALANGDPFCFGFTVYESFMTQTVADTGEMPMPDFSREADIGGHAVVALGYNMDTKKFWCRNSWGTGWGLQGYFWMPEAYIADPQLVADLWVARTVA